LCSQEEIVKGYLRKVIKISQKGSAIWPLLTTGIGGNCIFNYKYIATLHEVWKEMGCHSWGIRKSKIHHVKAMNLL
jgi:hypothetical protein